MATAAKPTRILWPVALVVVVVFVVVANPATVFCFQKQALWKKSGCFAVSHNPVTCGIGTKPRRRRQDDDVLSRFGVPSSSSTTLLLSSSSFSFSNADDLCIPNNLVPFDVSTVKYEVRYVASPPPAAKKKEEEEPTTADAAADPWKYPLVTLFYRSDDTENEVETVEDTLRSTKVPHSLVRVNVLESAAREWFGRYKYNLPLLHVNQVYWRQATSLRPLRLQEATACLSHQALLETGTMEPGRDEPNAAEMERQLQVSSTKPQMSPPPRRASDGGQFQKSMIPGRPFCAVADPTKLEEEEEEEEKG